MSLISVEFLILILLLFALYFPAGKFFPKYQWTLLLIASFVFYAFASWKFIPFLLTSTVITWTAGLLIGKVNQTCSNAVGQLDKSEESFKSKKKELQKKSSKQKNLIMAISVALNLGILVILKYANFFLDIFGANFTLTWIIFPLGISFYTFQSIGYCVDIHRGLALPEKNFFRYALYISYFPQISQGPIGQYKELSHQLTETHQFSYEHFTSGLERVLLGLFKKLFIADNIALCVDHFYKDPSSHLSVVMIVVTFLYGIQLYADFSGYMDIVIGISQCLGIRLAENFSTPYFSVSIAEFWRRWHISLGTWFRDYLYYPILRTRLFSNFSKSLKKKKNLSRKLPTVFALLITWLLIGFWHGASWKFVVYGLYHGSFVILDTILSGFYDRTRKVLHIREESRLFRLFRIVRTFVLVNIGYVLFRSQSLGIAIDVYKGMLTNLTFNGLAADVASCGQAMAYFATVAVGILVLFIIELLEQKKTFVERINGANIVVRWTILFIMLYIVLLYALTVPADSGNFLYFNF